MTRQLLPDWVLQDVDLTAHNTLALPARAAWLAKIDSVEQLHELAAVVNCPIQRFILGGGSNLVLTEDFEGLVLHMALSGKMLATEDHEAWYVTAAAGEQWHDFVLWTLQMGWPGLENLVLIPGTVGAAPIQNIGAYGLELSDRFFSLNALDMESGEIRAFSKEECRFSYRGSLFKEMGWHLDGRFVITEVTFRLPKVWRANIAYADLKQALSTIENPTADEVANAVIALRQSKLPDPEVLPNAGSFFQNPLVNAAELEHLLARYPEMPHYPQADGRFKLAAGWLIEKALWKGKRLGKVGMYEKQALVLVNYDQGNGADVMALTKAVQNDVKNRFGIDLMPEPVLR